MFASRRAFWAVAPRAASCPFVARVAVLSRPASVRLYSSEMQASQESSPPPSIDTPSPAESPDSNSNKLVGDTSSPSTTNSSSSNGTQRSPNTSKQSTKAQAKPNQLNKSTQSRPAALQSTVVRLPATVSDHVIPSEVDTSPLSIDWASSYYGISSRPVSEEQFKVLMAPLDETDIEVKPDGVIYLPEIKYRRRLNAAFGPMGWGMIPRGEAVVGDNIVTREYALIVGGRFVAQAQGENQYFNAEQLPSAVEGCKSNALMRCCKDLGIASELWDPTFIRKFRKTSMESRWAEHATTNKKRQMWFRKGLVEVAYPYRLSKGSN